MVIDCLWVSGQFKGHGYSNLLLDACIEDSKVKGKKGLVILSSKKKLGFLSDPGYMRHKDFVTADTAEPYFELLYLPFMEGAERPRFRDTVRKHEVMPQGFALYYTNQCPFTAKYVPVLERMAKERNVVFYAPVCFLLQNQVPPAKQLAYFLFGAYVIIVLAATVIVDASKTAAADCSLNLVPFRVFHETWGMPELKKIAQTAANVVMFVPLGFIIRHCIPPWITYNTAQNTSYKSYFRGRVVFFTPSKSSRIRLYSSRLISLGC